MKRLLFFLCISALFQTCNTPFLDIKRESNQAIPSNVEDYLNLMDNDILNSQHARQLGMLGGDEYFVQDGSLHTLSSPLERNAYIWGEDIYENTQVPDWNISYQRMLYCNIVLEGLAKLNQPDQPAGHLAKGMAHYYRASSFFALQETFGQVYDAKDADTKLGIPLRLQSDVTQKEKRATVAATYKQILADLHESLPLLPDKIVSKYRPSKQTAYMLLAKIYLQMHDYPAALDAATSAMELGYTLMDYNKIDTLSLTPFPSDVTLNSEIMLYNSIPPTTIFRNRYSVSEELLSLYQEGDLRRSIFYHQHTDGRILFKGSYLGHGSGAYSADMSADELLLIRAECLARLNRHDECGALLDELLHHRFIQGVTPRVPANDELLAFVLDERRRELVFRGVRWMDLRRLNLDARFAKTLQRRIDGKEYILEPKSNRYAWPIPDDAVQYGGIEQNSR